MKTTPLEFNKFSGGITDQYLPGPPDRYQRCDNLLITDNEKLLMRPGSTLYDSTYYQIPAGNQRIGALINFDTNDELLYSSARALYHVGGAGWVTLTGPDGNPVLAAGTVSDRLSWTQWNHMLFLTNGATGSKVMKLYKDQAGVFQVRNAGLPKVADDANYVDATVLASALTLANDLRTQLLAHFDDYGVALKGDFTALSDTVTNIDDTSEVVVGMYIQASNFEGVGNVEVLSKTASTITLDANAIGSDVTRHNFHLSTYIVDALHKAEDTVSAALVSAPAATDLATLLALTEDLLLAYENHYLDTVQPEVEYHLFGANGGRENPLVATVSAKLSSATAPTTLAEAVERLNDLRKCYNFHDGDLDVHTFYYWADINTALPVGYHQVTTAPLDTLTTGPSFQSGLQDLLDLANGLKTAMNLHMADGGFTLTGDTTLGDPTITNIADTTGVSDADSVFSSQFDVPTGVNSHTATTITCSTNATATAVGTDISIYHPDHDAHEYPDTTNVVTAADATDATTLRTLIVDLRESFIGHFQELRPHYFRTPGDSGLVDEDFLDNSMPSDLYYGVREDDIESMRAALVELKTAWNAHDADMTKHYRFTSDAYVDANVGDPDLIPPVQRYQISGADPTSADYLYAFHHAYTYEVGNKTYVDYGPVLIKEAMDVHAIETRPMVISNIPELENGATDNYDTANITIRIYRTIDGGQNFYLVGEVDNGTTTFTDRVTDTELTANEPLYTEGGVVDNDPPPEECRYIHTSNGYTYYGYYKEISTGDTYPNRVLQAIKDDPDSVPESFYVEFDEEVTGISSVRENTIVFCNESTYRLEGTFDERGQGFITKVRISDVQGCISHLGIVQTDGGLFFPSETGFCFTDGYRVIQISDWDDTYALLTNSAAKKSRITGAYDKYTGRIWWGMTLANDATDNDSCYILDLNWSRIAEGRGVFTSASGGDNFAPTALCLFDKELLRADSRGYTFKFSDDLTTDPVVDTAAVPSTWASAQVIYNYTSCGIDAGSSSQKKWAARISLRAKNESNITAQINANNDDGRNIKALTPVRFRGNVVWGDATVQWGDPNLFWNYDGLIEDVRRFPAGSMRWLYKQIQLTNAWVAILGSDGYGTGTVDHTAKTIVLDDTVTYDWPENIVGYSIAFADDGYVAEYEITARTDADTLTFADPDGDITTSASREWVVRGYPKGEKLHLLNYTIHIAGMGQKSTPAYSYSSGENV